jgi:Arc/MetJ family transcription regulator
MKFTARVSGRGVSLTGRYSYFMLIIQPGAGTMASSKSAARKRRGLPRAGSGRKKTLRLDQDLLDRARQALGVRTETDAVTQALEAVVRRQQQVEGLRLLATLGPIDARRID